MAALISTPISLLRTAAFEPLITGPLLLILLRGPPKLRDPLINLLADRLPTAITTLKWLFGLGLTSRINAVLNRLALSHWSLSRPGQPWSFSTSAGADEIILITGGCSGFGLMQTRMFAKRAPRAKLIILDRSDLPSELASYSNLSYYKADLTDFPSLRQICNTIKKEVGNPTVLINNAGIAAPIKTILDMDTDAMQKVFVVNTFSHVPLIQEFLPAMLEAKKGHVVTFASMASYATVAGIVDYCASKAAVLAMHEGLSFELRDRYTNGKSINTTIVHPTWADTGLTKSWMKRLGTNTTPTEVAGAVVNQVLAGRSGPLYVPESMGNVLYLRGMPIWVGSAVGILSGIEKTTR